MPPKTRITREMILNTVLDITREAGFEAVNARSVAKRLQCSTRPLFTCYENMEALKKEFLEFAFDFYEQYAGGGENAGGDVLGMALSYIAFAREEPELFRLLFIDDMELDMREPEDFYREPGNEKKAERFSRAAGLNAERGRAVFLDLFLYAHGIAVLTASKKLSLSGADVEKMAGALLEARITKEKAEEERCSGMPCEKGDAL